MSIRFTWGGASLVLVALALAPLARASDPAAAAIRVARDKVFPTLVHLQPVFDHAVGGRTIESALNGSGVVIAADGLVVTNFHVAGRAKRLTCTLSDRRRCTAERVGADAATDLALVRLHLDELGVESLPFAAFDEHDDLEAGDPVIAMGSPLGLTRSLSCGVVSCLDRVLPDLTLDDGIATGTYNLWIQTDAAINPGNSGGPLVNLAGEIVGINTRGFRGAENLGFAIPANVVREVVGSLLRDGRVKRASLGVRLQPVTDLGRGGDLCTHDGVLIGSITPDGPADRAGIRAGDVVTSIAGAAVRAEFEEDLPAIRRAVAKLPIDAPVEIALRRGAESRTVSAVTVDESSETQEEADLSAFGLTTRSLSADERRERGLSDAEGIVVTGVRPGSAAGNARPALVTGDVVITACGAPIDSPHELESRLATAHANALLVIARGPARLWIALPIPADVAEAGR